MNQSELKANTSARAGRNWSVWFYFWLVQEVAREFLANHKMKQCKTNAIAKLFTALNKNAAVVV